MQSLHDEEQRLTGGRCLETSTYQTEESGLAHFGREICQAV
jgi:hypothetical protein